MFCLIIYEGENKTFTQDLGPHAKRPPSNWRYDTIKKHMLVEKI